MSFAVVRMAKMKVHDLKGIQFHNQREKDSKTNPDIDKSKIHLNYDLVNLTNIDYNKKVKEIIDTQKISTRKTRKDAVLVNELLITSDKDFFDKLSPEEEKKFFKESHKLFSERYGEQNIAYSIVHKDEKTPHMHLGIVPMRDGRLQGKNVFNRQELLWIQEEFPKHMQELGFNLERGEKGSKREHIETQQFKVNTLDQQVKELESNREDLEKDVQALLRAVEESKSLDEIQVDKGGLFTPRTVKLSIEDFESIKTLAVSSEALKTSFKKFKSDIGFYKASYDLEVMKLEEMKKENMGLKKENAQLKSEITSLQRTVERLKQTVNYLERTINYIKSEAQRMLSISKKAMREYVGIMRGQSIVNEFGNTKSTRNLALKIAPEDEKYGVKRFVEEVEEKERKIGRRKDDFEMDK